MGEIEDERPSGANGVWGGAPGTPLSGADRAGLLAQFPAPLNYSVPAGMHILSLSWGSPLALKALGEFEDERPSGANGVWGGAPGVCTSAQLSPPEAAAEPQFPGKGRGGAVPRGLGRSPSNPAAFRVRTVLGHPRSSPRP